MAKKRTPTKYAEQYQKERRKALSRIRSAEKAGFVGLRERLTPTLRDLGRAPTKRDIERLQNITREKATYIEPETGRRLRGTVGIERTRTIAGKKSYETRLRNRLKTPTKKEVPEDITDYDIDFRVKKEEPEDIDFGFEEEEPEDIIDYVIEDDEESRYSPFGEHGVYDSETGEYYELPDNITVTDEGDLLDTMTGEIFDEDDIIDEFLVNKQSVDNLLNIMNEIYPESADFIKQQIEREHSFNNKTYSEIYESLSDLDESDVKDLAIYMKYHQEKLAEGSAKPVRALYSALTGDKYPSANTLMDFASIFERDEGF